MSEMTHGQWQTRVAYVIFVIFSTWWLVNLLFVSKTNVSYQYFGETYALMALWGAGWGMYLSRHWGGLKSVVGKSLCMFSFGLFAQFFGQVAYSYSVYVLKIDNPYPSIGDFGYFGSIFCYILGVWFLAKASGVNIGLRTYSNKIMAVIIPLTVVAVGYFLFLRNYTFDWTNPIAVYLDFGYPVGEAVYISFAGLAYLLSRRVLGGILKDKILFILFALSVQFIADYTFLYETKANTWYVGGINDYLYFFAYFLMTLALLQMSTVVRKLKTT
jgi:hypothetical protein